MRTLAAVLFFSFALAHPLRAENAVPAVISQWIEAQQHMGGFKTVFKLTRTMPSLKQPLVNDGKLWRLADGRFRWELGTPPETVLMFDNTQLHLWDSTSKDWRDLSPRDASMRMWMHFLNSKDMTADSMTKDFTPTVTGETAEVTTIALQPKSMMMRKHLKQVDLQIDPKTKFLRQIRLLQGDDSSVLMSFALPQDISTDEAAKLQLKPTP